MEGSSSYHHVLDFRDANHLGYLCDITAECQPVDGVMRKCSTHCQAGIIEDYLINLYFNWVRQLNSNVSK